MSNTTDIMTNGKSVSIVATRKDLNVVSEMHDVSVSSYKDIEFTSTDNNINLDANKCINLKTTNKSINLDAPNGKINLISSNDIKLKSINENIFISSDRNKLNLHSYKDSNMISQWGDITIDAINGTVNIKSQKNINILPGPSGNVNITGNLNALSISQGPSNNQQENNNSVGLLVPTGSLIPYCGTTSPIGWFLCNGSLHSIITYNNLFNAIGYTFGGSGDFFAVPDMRGRVVVGASFGASGISNKNIGDASGSETHTLTIDEIPSHSHSVTENGGTFACYPVVGINQTDTCTSGGGNTGNAGGGHAHSIMQPYMTLNYIIKY